MQKLTGSLFTHHICKECESSVILTIIKQHTLFFSLSGIFVPNYCAREECKKRDTSNVVSNCSVTDTYIIDIDITESSSMDNRYSHMVTVDAALDGSYKETNNKTPTKRCINNKNIITSCINNKIKPTDEKGDTRNKNLNEKPSLYYTRSICEYLRLTFCCVYLLMELLEVLRTIYIISQNHADNTQFVYILGNVTFRVFLLFLTLTSNYANFTHFRSMCSAWLDYEWKYTLKTDVNSDRKRRRILFGSGILIQIFVFMAIVVGVVTPSQAFNFQTWPFDMTTGLSKWLAGVTFATLGFLGSCNIFIANMFVNAVIGVLVLEFQHLQQEVAEIVSQRGNHAETDEKFDKFVEQLRLLREVSQQSFQVVKHTIAAGYIFTLVPLCLVIYNLAGTNLTWNHSLLSLYTAGVVLGMLSTITAGCARLRLEASSVWSAVYKVSWSHQPPAMLQKLSFFMNQLSLDDISYSVYGMFTVDYPALMMVGGAVLTYGIFVLQLKLDNRN